MYLFIPWKQSVDFQTIKITGITISVDFQIIIITSTIMISLPKEHEKQKHSPAVILQLPPNKTLLAQNQPVDLPNN